MRIERGRASAAPHVAFVGNENLQPGTEHAEEHDSRSRCGPSNQEGERVAHGTEVGADVDGISSQQQGYDALQEPIRIMLADVAGNAVSRRATDAGADFLDRAHERVGKQQRPGYGVPKLTACLRVGAYTARIIILVAATSGITNG